MQNIKVPTGNILVVDGQKGKLEVLSIGDYGAEHNLKADFLGLHEDIAEVTETHVMPLEKKWVVTMSTQYGCSMGCKFCDVPKVGPGVNATKKDLMTQLDAALGLHPEVTQTERLNVHFARMGEPTWNPNVILFTIDVLGSGKILDGSLVHPVISTMLPKHNGNLGIFLNEWMNLKNSLFKGNAGLQFSINSTDDKERNKMFSGNTLGLADISKLGERLPFPVGRKITLNFALGGYKVDAQKLAEMFDPKRYVVKLTPLHVTHRAVENHLNFAFPYEGIEEQLKAAGFDVLVFCASKDEDLGRITCGNAILSGSKPFDIEGA